jgi:hypothetical protein
MKNLFLVAVLALSMGCAITNYPVMIDGETGTIINTNGKAMIIPTSQVITLWGTQNEELFSMIDQKADGDATIWTYTNITYGAPAFMDFTYCEPDWTGCAAVTADDPQPTVPFQYTINNCQGARSVSLLVSYYGRLTECGRLNQSPEVIGAVIDGMIPTANGYTVPVTPRNTSITATFGNGVQASIPVAPTTVQYLDPGFVITPSAAFGPTLNAAHQASVNGATDWRVCYREACIDLTAMVTQSRAEEL